MSQSQRVARGFLHIAAMPGYTDILTEILHAITQSGLYDKTINITVGVLGDPENCTQIPHIIAPYKRIHIRYHSTDLEEFELPTLGLLQDTCDDHDDPVYYLHTKGVTHPGDRYADRWRQLLLDEIVWGHQRCLAKLDEGADMVGTLWRSHTTGQHLPDHFAGNYWWARPAHIRKLPDVRDMIDNPIRYISNDEWWNRRLQAEFWLSRAPGRFANLGYSHRNPYKEYLPRLTDETRAQVEDQNRTDSIKTAIGAVLSLLTGADTSAG